MTGSQVSLASPIIILTRQVQYFKCERCHELTKCHDNGVRRAHSSSDLSRRHLGDVREEHRLTKAIAERSKDLGYHPDLPVVCDHLDDSGL